MQRKKRKILNKNQEVIQYNKPARTILNNYLLPHQSNFIAARAYHHSAWVAIASILYTKIRDHPDDYYCFASVKNAKQFATIFANKTIIILQNDKAKIGLKVPAVSQIFHTLQSVHEPVNVADHDFPLKNGQKLVPSVYLMIKPNKSHVELQTGQLAIFICCQWSLGTSLLSHMQDLKNLTLNLKYNDILKTNGEIQPIWVLLVDEGPDMTPNNIYIVG
ncbi:hypothetical protein GLOIN_2v1783204 [Rhizophagus clarus]|uniref:Uncharacterized protein n=1 Tax=Rhizophagus clarus TaxID=94130 RepID=A0A8H3QHZ9_9GLOM|nr:hypothetical protein GLOIN_2v1783204 [Rhizophagus clarus]